MPARRPELEDWPDTRAKMDDTVWHGCGPIHVAFRPCGSFWSSGLFRPSKPFVFRLKWPKLPKKQKGSKKTKTAPQTVLKGLTWPACQAMSCQSANKKAVRPDPILLFTCRARSKIQARAGHKSTAHTTRIAPEHARIGGSSYWTLFACKSARTHGGHATGPAH